VSGEIGKREYYTWTFTLTLSVVVLLYDVVSPAAAGHGAGNLEVGFYSTRCSSAESIVFETVKEELRNNPGVEWVPALYDCISTTVSSWYAFDICYIFNLYTFEYTIYY